MKYQPYPKYKESGVELLGEVPNDWEFKKIKYFANLKGGAGFPHSEQGNENKKYSFHKVNALAKAKTNDILLREKENTISKLTAKKLGAFIFPNNTLVFAKVGAALLLGRVRLLGEPACIDNNMMGLTANKKKSNYIFIKYFMSLVKFDYLVNPGAVPSINNSHISNLLCPFPSLSDQNRIARFLDYETTHIDSLIKEKENFISLLKEKRQALISHAVTKGLDPTVKMKDSRVEWIGDVPEQWNVTSIKYIAELGPKKENIESSLKCSFVPMKKLRTDSILLDEHRLVADVEDGYTFFKDEDILMAKVTPCFENKNIAVAKKLINKIGFGSSEIFFFRMIKKNLNRYLYYRLQEDKFMSIAKSSMTGTAGLKRVPAEVINNFTIAIPSIDEQQKIANFIDNQTDKIDSLVKETQNSIELLKEHRTALISAAVTGKIDVRLERA